MNNKIHDEYATKPRTIKPIFTRAIEYLGQLQIEVRKIETKPYYLRPPWRKNRYEQIDQFIRAMPKGSSSTRFRAKTAKILEKKIQRTYKNLHGRVQKIRKSWVRGTKSLKKD
jgi:hypothetical protein